MPSTSRAELGVGADVGLVAGVGDAAGDVHEALRVLVLLFPRGEPVHPTWKKKRKALISFEST